MELTFINWIDAKRSRTTRNSLNRLQIKIVMSADQHKNKYHYVSFSKELSLETINLKKIRFGYINEKIVFKLNNDTGLNYLDNNLKDLKNYTKRCASKEICEAIFESLNVENNQRMCTFDLVDLGENTFLINNKISL